VAAALALSIVVGLCVCARRCSVEAWTLSHHPTLPQVATGAQSGNVNVWDLESGAKMKTMTTNGKFVLSVDYVRSRHVAAHACSIAAPSS
jgi:hypothetical protein